MTGVQKMFFIEGRGALFFFMIAVYAVTYAVSEWAKKGKTWELRKLAPIDAISEGIGRAVELGRPVHFSAGVDRAGPGDPDRGHAYPMLRYVAMNCAQRNCRLITTVGKADVYAVIDQIVREAAIDAGKPEWYNPEDTRFLGEDQFVYAAGVMGILAREKVATNLMFGYHRGSLINMLEAGRMVGALQIGGMARMTGELGFMALGCDYFLVLEELVAAAAYISQDPGQLGTVATQDYIKFFLIAVIALGALLITGGIEVLVNLVNW